MVKPGYSEEHMLHELLKIWFSWVDQWGYLGVFVLMAMESSIIPVPSEVVMPPAAFWAAQGRLEFWGVVAAGAAGSYAGSIMSYYMAQVLGLPLLERYGKFILLPPKKLALAESWVRQFGVPGIFIARLLPVVRHLISYPAGVFRMPFLGFSAATATGAALWCGVLAWFGREALGSHPELLESPEKMIAVVRAQVGWLVAAAAVFGFLYLLVVMYRTRKVRGRGARW